jgi:uncharacterized protein (DUF433 family)
MAPSIIDRGRGPEIAGSRITVFDVLAETRAGVPVEQLAREWQLTVEQIELALRYIDEHREEVEREWAEIQAWHARERARTEAKYGHLFAASHEKLMRMKAELDRRRSGGSSDARAPGGREHPGTNGECPHAIRVTVKILEIIMDIDNYRGVGRLYAP